MKKKIKINYKKKIVYKHKNNLMKIMIKLYRIKINKKIKNNKLILRLILKINQ